MEFERRFAKDIVKRFLEAKDPTVVRLALSTRCALRLTWCDCVARPRRSCISIPRWCRAASFCVLSASRLIGRCVQTAKLELMYCKVTKDGPFSYESVPLVDLRMAIGSAWSSFDGKAVGEALEKADVRFPIFLNVGSGHFLVTVKAENRPLGPPVAIRHGACQCVVCRRCRRRSPSSRRAWSRSPPVGEKWYPEFCFRASD
jgi:hypothetical protein